MAKDIIDTELRRTEPETTQINPTIVFPLWLQGILKISNVLYLEGRKSTAAAHCLTKVLPERREIYELRTLKLFCIGQRGIIYHEERGRFLRLIFMEH